MSSTPSLTLPLVDGTRVVVPDSLNLITPYVLQEQLDWFEDEIKFLRHLLKPGQKVIDIGANYGVYTMSMAQAVGATGGVWAFEPASTTAAFLAQSVATNGFGHVVIEKAALSREPGEARLRLHDNAELNELVRGDGGNEATETVPVTTLDASLERFGWEDIVVLKMDAEGEEANILKGGERFFSSLSPLVLYEVKAGTEYHLELVAAFTALGYRSYRLVPGLDLLAPFDAAEKHDSYLLNLFACKPDRARQLAAAGLLVEEPLAMDPPPRPEPRHGWQAVLAPLPFATSLGDVWKAGIAGPQGPALEQALALHGMSRDTTLAPPLRLQALTAALQSIMALCGSNVPPVRLLTLARVAREFGNRSTAVQALNALADAILKSQSANISEPFLPPAPRHELTNPGSGLGNWLLGSTVEELELLSAYSSFFSGAKALPRLDLACQLGFAGDEMRRRQALLKRRLGA